MTLALSEGFISRGTAAYWKMGLALFLAGLSTFSLLTCVQSLLPEFAAHFVVSPAESALALSLSMGALAVSIVAAGAFSQTFGRRGVMFFSLATAALLNVAAAMAPSWPLMLLARCLEGLALGGVPAVAMAYLAEEMDRRDLDAAMGLYVAGTASGALVGNVATAALAELIGWRAGMSLIGLLGLAAAFAFVTLLPPSRNFVRQGGMNPSYHLSAWAGHLENPRLLRLFAIGFVIQAVFVTLQNYVVFRLGAKPFDFNSAQSASILMVFALGSVASPMAGRLVSRIERRSLLLAGFSMMAIGILFTLPDRLGLIALGMSIITVGFYATHTVASGWLGRLAGNTRGHAASIYLLFYYVGASVVGTAGGWFWEHAGWLGVAALTGLFTLGGTLLACGAKNEDAAQNLAE